MKKYFSLTVIICLLILNFSFAQDLEPFDHEGENSILTEETNYEMELSEYADGLSAKIEPIMLLVMAGVVGFVVIAMALPMMKMGEVVSNIK